MFNVYYRNQTVKGELEGPEDKVLEIKKWLQVLVFIILIYQSFFGFEYDRCPKYDINIFKFTLLREVQESPVEFCTSVKQVIRK